MRTRYQSTILAAILAASITAALAAGPQVQRFPISHDAAVKIRALDAQEANLRVQIQAIQSEKDATLTAEYGRLGLHPDNWRYNRRYAAFEPRPKKAGKL